MFQAPPKPKTTKPKTPPAASTEANKYERHKRRVSARNADQSRQARDIAPLPPVKDPARRARGLASLEAFEQAYFPRRFKIKSAPVHRTAGQRLQSCTDEGGLFALALPRGYGKTAKAEVAVIRAVVYGLRKFVLLVQATGPLAGKSLKKIQREFETNDLLAEDFPEVCYPIRRLERIHNRARGQTLNGKPTGIEWTAEGVRLPTVEGAASSGATIQVVGITGAIRGASTTQADGEVNRPDMVVIDDAQTRDSAKSPIQTDDRAAIITSDILGLSGPDVTMAAVMLCTVIYQGDLSDRFLSPEKSPEWQGLRMRMIETFPTSLTLWDQYSEIRQQGLRDGDKGAAATAFYRKNRVEMDRGAKVSWPDRKKAGELSGLQSAMNLYYRDPKGFAAEYQNEPEEDTGPTGSKEIDPEEVAKRLSGLDRYTVPREASRLTAFIDVGANVLWYAVAAWDDHFGGSFIDYGPFPSQSRRFFAANDARPTLASLYPNYSEEQRVYAGLDTLTRQILGRTYARENDRAELRIDRLLIDSGWQTATVYQFCRQSPYAGIIHPSKGIARTTTSLGIGQWKRRPGEIVGWNWRLTSSESGVRLLQFDPDAWKTFLYGRLTTPAGGAGYTSFYGADAGHHEMIAHHAAAEASSPITARGTTFDKWTVRPHGPDNHYFDCLTGCAVAASNHGLKFSATGEPEAAIGNAAPVRLSEIQRARRAGESPTATPPTTGQPATSQPMKLSGIQRQRKTGGER